MYQGAERKVVILKIKKEGRAVDQGVEKEGKMLTKMNIIIHVLYSFLSPLCYYVHCRLRIILLIIAHIQLIIALLYFFSK